MIKTKAGYWKLIPAMLFCFAACGKKDDAVSTPELSAPQAMEKIEPAAEVKASSGPVELSLLLRETRIKAGDSIWQQIRIRNNGDKEIIVGDPIFFNPRELRKQSRSRYGIYLEAMGPGGKPLKVENQTSAYQGNDLILDRASGFLEVEGPEEQAMLDGWKKQGLSLREINTKLLDYNMKKRDAAENHQRRPIINLLPGQAIESKYAFFYSIQDKIHNRPIPRPIGNFSQVDFFVLEQPGKYEIRAVYDHRPGDFSREFNIPAGPEDVLVRTPWVTITVAP